MNDRCCRLRNLIQARGILIMPGVHDALSARVFEAAGFQAVQCSSWGIAAAAGLPEGGVHSFADNRESIRKIACAVDIPVNADAESGYGGPRHVSEVARELILVGAAGMNLEDAASRAAPAEPLRLIPLDEMLDKIGAVIAAKRALGSDFVLNARTDALLTGGDPETALKEAIARGRAFARAGADLIFAYGARTREQIARLVGGIDAPVSISGEGLDLTVRELEALGVARVSFGVASVRAAAGAVAEVARAIRDHGSVQSIRSLTSAVDVGALVQIPRKEHAWKRD
jgi:2-methylisocitrate lyase-like PEP mutase family enzyme